MPAVENLKKVLKREDVIIAKFNVRGNDCNHPMINTQQVPKLYLFTAEDQETPKEYKSGRDVGSFVKFIKMMVPLPESSSGEETRTDL